jgi:DNA (cytosine-5)-methyltransferase 1
MKSDNPNSGIQKVETARTLDGNGGNPACNQGGIMIVDKVYPKSSFATYTEDTKAGTLRASGGDFGGGARI